VAREHAREQDLAIDYRAESLEALAKKKARFNAVLALEVVEHVTDPAQFLGLAAGLVEPGGALILSTLNRTPKAYLFAIFGAEYVLRWLPRGTHSFRKFCRPSELALALRRAGLKIEDMAGLNYDLVRSLWRLGPDLRVNYLIFATKPRRK
jgi:2-polyprenyl-6-hydroxyphenyl methylase/3-demethylubiquinone-9 3-methyltransferase